jgi:hypothetical protein
MFVVKTLVLKYLSTKVFTTNLSTTRIADVADSMYENDSA